MAKKKKSPLNKPSKLVSAELESTPIVQPSPSATAPQPIPKISPIEDLFGQQDFRKRFVDPSTSDDRLNVFDPSDNFNIGNFNIPGGVTGAVKPPGPIRAVGQVSGPVIGSQPIFAADTTLPLGNVSSREFALQEAAEKEANAKKKAAAGFNPLKDIGKIDDVRFNENFTRQVSGEIKGVMETLDFQTGSRAKTRQFLTENPLSDQAIKLDNIIKSSQIYATQANTILSNAAEINEGIEKGDRSYPQATMDLQRELLERTVRFQDSDPQTLMDNIGEFNGVANIGKYISTNISPQLEGIVRKYISEGDIGGKRGVVTQRIQQAAEQDILDSIEFTVRSLQLREEGFTEEEIKIYVEGPIRRLAEDKIESTFSQFSSTFGKKEEEEQIAIGDIKRYQPKNIPSRVIKIDPDDPEEHIVEYEQTRMTSPATYGHSDARHPLSIGELNINMETGESFEFSGSIKANFGSTEVTPIVKNNIEIQGRKWRKGELIPDKNLSTMLFNKAVKYEVYSYGTTQVKKEKDVFSAITSESDLTTMVSVAGPSSQFASALRKQEVPLDELNRIAKKINRGIESGKIESVSDIEELETPRPVTTEVKAVKAKVVTMAEVDEAFKVHAAANPGNAFESVEAYMKAMLEQNPNITVK